MAKTKKLFKLIDKLEEELIYINGAFDHIKSHIVNKKDQPIMSASTLTVDLKNGVDLINKIIEEKNKEKNNGWTKWSTLWNNR